MVTRCEVSEADVVAMDQTCGAVWRGSKGEGEACTSDYECAGADTGAVECNETFVNGKYQGACAKSAGAPERGVKGSACNAT